MYNHHLVAQTGEADVRLIKIVLLPKLLKKKEIVTILPRGETVTCCLVEQESDYEIVTASFEGTTVINSLCLLMDFLDEQRRFLEGHLFEVSE